MRITLTRAVGGHTKGATIDRIGSVAEHLIAAGVAVEAEVDEPEATATSDEPKPEPKQTRRSQRRKTTAPSERAGAQRDEPAGQRGGGVLPRSSPITAG